MKHKIKNIDKVERTLPVYDGTKRFIKFGEVVEAEITTKVRYMINNGFFKDLGKVEEKEARIIKEEPLVEPSEEYVPKYRKKRAKRIKQLKTEDD